MQLGVHSYHYEALKMIVIVVKDKPMKMVDYFLASLSPKYRLRWDFIWGGVGGAPVQFLDSVTLPTQFSV